MRAFFLLGLVACSTQDDTPNPALEFQFAMAVIADSHLGGSDAPAERLTMAVDWINTHRQARQIEIVPVLGDIAWGDGLWPARTRLDALEVPYIPVMGDNEVAFGDEMTFAEVFAPQLDVLAAEFEDWRVGGGLTYNPVHDQQSHFQTYAFRHHDLEFLVLDWASRSTHKVLSEMADRHDFTGGVWPWFTEYLRELETGLDHRVVMLTHNPMYMGVGGFNVDDFNAVAEETIGQRDAIWANLAGHLHYGDTIDLGPEAGYDVHLIDALWDDVMTIQVIDVYRDANGFVFEQENITVPG